MKTKNIYMALCLVQILCCMLIYNNEGTWFNEYVYVDIWLYKLQIAAYITK